MSQNCGESISPQSNTAGSQCPKTAASQSLQSNNAGSQPYISLKRRRVNLRIVVDPGESIPIYHQMFARL